MVPSYDRFIFALFPFLSQHTSHSPNVNIFKLILIICNISRQLLRYILVVDCVVYLHKSDPLWPSVNDNVHNAGHVVGSSCA